MTSNHSIYSADRLDFVPAGELRVGETLRNLDGVVRIESIEQLGTEERVYNLEIHGEHVFRVASSGVLVHNSSGADAPVKGLNQTYNLGLQSSRSSILGANRKIYSEFVENGGKLIVKRNVTRLGDDGAQILGEFNSVNKTISLYRGSNLSTVSEELIHFRQILSRDLLGKRIPKSLIDVLESDAATVLKQWGFVPR